MLSLCCNLPTCRSHQPALWCRRAALLLSATSMPSQSCSHDLLTCSHILVTDSRTDKLRPMMEQSRPLACDGSHHGSSVVVFTATKFPHSTTKRIISSDQTRTSTAAARLSDLSRQSRQLAVRAASSISAAFVASLPSAHRKHVQAALPEDVPRNVASERKGSLDYSRYAQLASGACSQGYTHISLISTPLAFSTGEWPARCLQ